VEKILELARPMSLMHSMISFTFVNVGILVEFTEILNNLKYLPLLLRDTENRGVVKQVGPSHHPKF